MVELTMMGRLLEALRPEARLVLVGDPRQLTSVGAGAVLSDLVPGYEGRPDSPVVRLTENFRFQAGHQVARRRAAGRGRRRGARGAARVLGPGVVRRGARRGAIEALRPDSVAAAAAVRERAEAEDADGALEALDRYRLLCAHREGPYGVRRWNRLVERWLAEDAGTDLAGGPTASGTSAARCW